MIKRIGIGNSIRDYREAEYEHDDRFPEESLDEEEDL